MADSTHIPSSVQRPLLALVLGCVCTLVALEGSLWAAHRAFLAYQAGTISAGAAEDGRPVVRILAVGESTTAVAGNASGTLLVPGTSWPAQLQTVLNERQDAVHFVVTNAGVMGGTSAAAIDLMHERMGAADPHMIIAMMGIMDTPSDIRDAQNAIPGWLGWLRTAQLIAWLTETHRLKEASTIFTAQTVADLPRSGRDGSLMPVGRHPFELRLRRDPAAKDQIELAAYLSHTGYHERAEQVLRGLISDNGTGYSALAHHLMGLDRVDDALEVMNEARAAHPEEGLYWVLSAEIQAHAGDIDAANQTLHAARERLDTFDLPNVVHTFLQLQEATLLLDQGELEAAIELASTVEPLHNVASRQLVPNEVVAREKLIGRAYMASQQWDRAETHLLNALSAQPDRALNMMWTLTEVYRKSGQSEKESKLRQELLARTGRIGEYLELARLLRSQGDHEAAESVLDDANRQTPSLRAAYSHLYRTAAARGSQLVVVQYPMFPLRTLHRWAPTATGVHFTDTEHIFDGQVADSYADVGAPVAFSHYSKAGARTLAEAIAETVLTVYPQP